MKQEPQRALSPGAHCCGSFCTASVHCLLCIFQQPCFELHLHTLAAWGLLTLSRAHAAEDSLPELNYEGEPLKLSRFLQDGVRRPVLVRDSCLPTSHPQTLQTQVSTSWTLHVLTLDHPGFGGL